MKITDIKLYQGNTWMWEESLEDYSVLEYDLDVYFQRGTNKITSRASIVNSIFRFNIPSTETAQFPSGVCDIEIIATHKTTNAVTTIFSSTKKIVKSLAAILDERTFYEIVLENIEIAIKDNIGKGFGQITMPGGKSITYKSDKELSELHAKYKYLVQQERDKQNGRSKVRIHKYYL